MGANQTYEKELILQSNRRRAAVAFIKAVSDLWYEQAIELVLFRNRLIDKNVSEILNLHEYAGDFVQKPISVFDTTEIASAILLMDLPPSKLDIGKLTFEYQLEGDAYGSVNRFVQSKLEQAKNFKLISPKDVILYGFGRIGRLLARELMALTGKGNQLRLRAVVTRGEITKAVLEKRASLLQRDSVHGDFSGTVRVDAKKQALLVNGTTIQFLSADQPENIDYTAYGIKDALLIDNTGAFREERTLARHLKAKGVGKVLLTAPGKGVPNIVHGVNHLSYDPDTVTMFSAASCTTNAITPVLQAVHQTFGIQKGHLETIHAYTNDQNLVDNMHPKYRRGRAAALNMVITETGAGKAVSKAIPSLEGRLTSNAIRVPVPNGSLAILNLSLDQKISKESFNKCIKKFALEGDLVEQIKYSIENELVSTDIIGSSAPSIYDSNATIVTDDGKNVILYVWYDNEYGYSQQVIRLAKYIAKVRRFTYY